jgi:hypothetical protein
MSKVKRIRVSISFTKLSNVEVLSRGRAIQQGMAGNPAYPNPPVDNAAFEALLDRYDAAITGALDGGKMAIAERNQLREEVIATVRLYGPYVEITSNGDLGVFLSSGFQAGVVTRSAPQPLSPPTIVRIDQGVSRQLLIGIKKLPTARSYELRHAPIDTAGVPGAWTNTMVTLVKQAVRISNLTPGTTYAFQARALNHAGFSAWSDSVTRMCI